MVDPADTGAVLPASRVRLRVGMLGWAALVLSACAPGASPPPEGPAPVHVEVGVGTPSAPSLVSYTAPQAERGQETFQAVCSACHALGEFRGTMFRVTWMTRPIGHFFQLIGTTMPQDAPGSLTPGEYAAVVAYVLQLNGAAKGSEELPADIEVLEGLAWPQ